MAQKIDKPQNPALRKAAVIGSGFSIWETMTEQQLIDRLEEMKGEHAYLQDAIGRAERELFYRRNPDLKRQ
jgi:hypothetical protein